MLATEGYHVLRFWNNDVLKNTDGVVSEIHSVLRSRLVTPTPARPPQGGGGNLWAPPSTLLLDSLRPLGHVRLINHRIIDG